MSLLQNHIALAAAMSSLSDFSDFSDSKYFTHKNSMTSFTPTELILSEKEREFIIKMEKQTINKAQDKRERKRLQRLVNEKRSKDAR